MQKKKLTKKQLIASLTKLEVEIPKGATPKNLELLLKKTQEANAKLKAEPDGGETKEDDSAEVLNKSVAGEEESDEGGEDGDDSRITSEDEGEIEDKEEEKEEDYLLKYQFGMDDKGPFRKGDPRSNPASGGKAERMKKHLLKQKRITIMIPAPDNEDPDYPHSVTLNGYRLDLPRNTYIDVPEQVSDIIIEQQKQQAKALRPMRLDRKEGGKNFDEALS